MIAPSTPTSRDNAVRRGDARGLEALRIALATCIFAAIAVGFFNPVFRSDATFSTISGHQSVQWPWAAEPTGAPDFPQSDQANNVYPIEVDVDKDLGRAVLPTWSRKGFGGLPTAGSVYSGMAYPGHLVSLALLTPDWAHDIFMLVHVWLAGLSMFLLMRYVLAASWLASLIGGVTWMLSPSWWGLIQLEGYAVLAAALPAAVALGLLAARRQSLPLAGACSMVIALLILGASVQNGVFALTIVCGAMAFENVLQAAPGKRLRRLFSNLGLAAVTAIIGAGLTAFLLLPTQRALADSDRAEVPIQLMLDEFGLSLRRLSQVFTPDSPMPLTGRNVWTLVFLGTAGGCLALIGLISRRRGAWLGRTTTLGYLLLLTGTPLALTPAYHLIPGFRYIEPLGRLTPFAAFGAAILVTLGADVVLDGARRLPRFGRLAPIALALALFGLQVWQLATYDRAINPPWQPRDDAFLFPQTPLLRSLVANRPDPSAGGEQRIAAMRRGSATDPFFPPPLFGLTALVFGIENVGGYFNVMPDRSRSMALMLEGHPPEIALSARFGAYGTHFFAADARWELFERFGVTDIVSAPRTSGDPAAMRGRRMLGTRLVYQGPDGAIDRVAEPLPRAFYVSRAEHASGEVDALHRYTDPAFPYRTTVLLEGERVKASDHSTAAGDVPVSILPSAEDTRSLHLDAPRAGWVVLLDSWAPGWTARVDGRPAPVERANFAFQAIPVAAGSANIELRYDPPGLKLGLALSAASGVVLLGMLSVPFWRRGRTVGRLRGPESATVQDDVHPSAK